MKLNPQKQLQIIVKHHCLLFYFIMGLHMHAELPLIEFSSCAFLNSNLLFKIECLTDLIKIQKYFLKYDFG